MSISDALIAKLGRMVDIERSKRKAGQLGDMASLNEAEAFASKIQQLLLQHNLTMSEVEFTYEKANNPIGVEWWEPGAWGAKELHMRSPWREELAAVVATAHLCRFLVTDTSNMVCFIGRDGDRKCAIYAYGMLVRFAEQRSRYETRKVRRHLRKEQGGTESAYGYRNAWLRGFNLRIAERYRAMERESVIQAAQQSQALSKLPGGEPTTALTLHRRLADTRQEVAEWTNHNVTMEEVGPRKAPAIDNLNGLMAGYEAGGRVELDRRGLESPGGTPLIGD